MYRWSYTADFDEWELGESTSRIVFDAAHADETADKVYVQPVEWIGLSSDSTLVDEINKVVREVCARELPTLKEHIENELDWTGNSLRNDINLWLEQTLPEHLLFLPCGEAECIEFGEMSLRPYATVYYPNFAGPGGVSSMSWVGSSDQIQIKDLVGVFATREEAIEVSKKMGWYNEQKYRGHIEALEVISRGLAKRRGE